MAKAKKKKGPGSSPLLAEASLGHLAQSIRVVPVSYPKPDPANPRHHTDRNMATIKASLSRHGMVMPLLIEKETRFVIQGHGTLEAVKELGGTHVAIIEVAKDSKQREELRDLMNRAAELSEWDYKSLAESFRRYMVSDDQMSLIGWEKFETEPILAADWTPPPRDDLNPKGHDQAEPIQVSKKERKSFEMAVALVRAKMKDPKLSEGICLAVICGYYLKQK